jgi:hypothetical protein
VFAGTCEANNPGVWDGDYFQTTPGSDSHAQLDPGGSETVEVIVPTLNLTVQRSSDSFTRVHVTVDQRDSAYDCSDEIYDSGSVSFTAKTSHLLSIPLPFGRYRICASVYRDVSGSSNDWRRLTSSGSTSPSDPDLTTPADKSITAVVAASGSSNGASSGECS